MPWANICKHVDRVLKSTAEVKRRLNEVQSSQDDVQISSELFTVYKMLKFSKSFKQKLIHNHRASWTDF